MIFQSSNWEDISRYYRNTYVKFKETGDRLFFIRRVDNYAVTGTDEDGTEFELYLNDEHPYEVDYILPRKSYFQVGKRATMLARIPAKQYQRGISNGNTMLTSLNKNGGIAKHEIGFEILKQFVTKQTYWTLEEAVKNKGRNTSIALSPRFAYVPDINTIFVDQRAIATVDKKDKTVTMALPIFRNEVLALVKDSKFKVL